MKAGVTKSFENVQNYANGTICQLVSNVVSYQDLMLMIYDIYHATNAFLLSLCCRFVLVK